MSAFDFTTSIGYWIIGLVLTAIFFTLFALFAVGFKMNVYSSTYGADIVNLEEYIFSCYEYVDPVTDFVYPRIIDFKKITTIPLQECLDVAGYVRKGVQVELYTNGTLIQTVTSDYYVDTPLVTKGYPVLITRDGTTELFESGAILMEFSNP